MRFLADEMCGALSRWLRLLGYFTKFAKDYEDKYGIPVLDSDLLNECFQDHLILVSKDQEMVERFNARYKQLLAEDPSLPKHFDIENCEVNTIPAILLESSDIVANLQTIYDHFHIRTAYDAKIARCSHCNTLIQKIENKNQYKNQIPERVFEYHNNFWKCQNPECGKIYWRGTHFSQIEDKLKKISKEN